MAYGKDLVKDLDTGVAVSVMSEQHITDVVKREAQPENMHWGASACKGECIVLITRSQILSLCSIVNNPFSVQTEQN